MNYRAIKFSGNAVRQMLERRIRVVDITDVIATGEVITEYPDDNPYPSASMLGFVDEKPVHIVVAMDYETETAKPTFQIDNCGMMTTRNAEVNNEMRHL